MSFFDAYGNLDLFKLIIAVVIMIVSIALLLMFTVAIFAAGISLFKSFITFTRTVKYEWKNRNTIY